MFRRQQVINLDILHFFISSYLTFNESSPLTKVLLKLTLKQGQPGAEPFWGWMAEEEACRRAEQRLRKGSSDTGQPGFTSSFECQYKSNCILSQAWKSSPSLILPWDDPGFSKSQAAQAPKI